MSYCPSQDWDRYVSQFEGPLPVGQPYEAISPRDHICDACWDKIPAGMKHHRHDQHNEEGQFIAPLRLHLPGTCPRLEE